MSTSRRSYNFTMAITRKPGNSVISGLRATDTGDPNADLFRREHQAYITSLEAAGIEVIDLPPLEAFPDSVFVEDTALCVGSTAIILRPGAPTRRGEVKAVHVELEAAIEQVIDLPGDGFVEGGDVLLAEDEAFIGLSARTNEAGLEALSAILSGLGYRPRRVVTPDEILHFKTDCGLLDAKTIFTTRRLAKTGCFDGFQTIFAPDGEEAAANLIRVNDVVLLSAGYPQTETLLENAGYTVQTIPTSQAALVDGGLSCMSLRCNRTATGRQRGGNGAATGRQRGGNGALHPLTCLGKCGDGRFPLERT